MRHLKHWIAAAFMLVALGCQAEEAPSSATPAESPAKASSANYEAGVHYEVLPQPVATVDSDKIEVAEVFWYGCGHCFSFESELRPWAESQPEDVVLVGSPAMWDNQGIMERHARIYYTAKALKVLDKVHEATFNAMHLEKKTLRSEGEIAELFVAQGVSKEDFERTFNSFGVTSAVKQAEARQRSYRIQGTPELIVNGKYRITARLAGSHQGMLDVADFLIEKERAAAN